jgi:hypothetical protein
VPLSGQVEGARGCVPEVRQYQLAKYDRGGPISCATSCSFVTRSRVTMRRPAFGKADLGTPRGAEHLGGRPSAAAPDGAEGEAWTFGAEKKLVRRQRNLRNA